MTSFLERYLDGDTVRVWHELRQLGGRVRDPELVEDVEAVVHAAMTRARDNVVVLVDRLRGQGYRFGVPWNESGALEPHAPPDESTPAFIAALEQRWGTLPTTARKWIEVVGDVNLMGVHPAWPERLVADPLVVEFEYKSWPSSVADRMDALSHFQSEYEAWEDNGGADGCGGAFVLDVAPDAWHKANFSGGPPYGIFVPDVSVDATFRFLDGVELSFIQYLRLAFRCGGFTGLWWGDLDTSVGATKRELTVGLLEI